MLCNWQDHPSIPYFANRPLAAHCLRLNNPWWELYAIGPKETSFSLTLTVDKSLATDPAATDAVSVVTISDTQPSATSSDLLASAQIQNYEESDSFPDLSSTHRSLVRKAPGAVHTLTKDDIMFLEHSFISEDGRACNKIGTYFTAFKYDSARPSHHGWAIALNCRDRHLENR